MNSLPGRIFAPRFAPGREARSAESEDPAQHQSANQDQDDNGAHNGHTRYQGSNGCGQAGFDHREDGMDQYQGLRG